MDTVSSGPRIGQTCLLLDFCEGGDLYHELKKQPECRLGERQAASVVRSIAKSLSRCHKKGFIHRDVKPENIFLRVFPPAKPWENKKGDLVEYVLADFGLARKFNPGHLITDGYVAGTPQYMAPEMIQGAYDERVDVWGLGMLLHVLLTGGLPSFVEHRCQHIDDHDHHDDISSLRKWLVGTFPGQLDLEAVPIYAELSQGARSLLLGMLRKEPQHRFTMSQVMADPWLQPSLAQLPASQGTIRSSPLFVRAPA